MLSFFETMQYSVSQRFFYLHLLVTEAKPQTEFTVWFKSEIPSSDRDFGNLETETFKDSGASDM